MASKSQQGSQKDNYLPKKLDVMAQNIYDWATNEMNYNKSVSLMPNVNDLKELCIGPMMDIFPFIVKHVKSKQTVQKIRGNVQLHSSITDTVSICKESLHSKIKFVDANISDLKSQIEEMKKIVTGLKKEIDDKTTECVLKEETQDQLMSVLDDTKEREILLGAQSLKTREKTGNFRHHEVLLGDILERCEQQSNHKATVFIERDGNIISVCMEDIQDSCNAIEKSIKRQVDNNVVDNEICAPDSNIFDSIKQTIESHDEAEIMDCLVEAAKKPTEFESDVTDDSQQQFSSDLQIQKILQINTFVKTKESQIKTHYINNKRGTTVSSIEEKLGEIYDDNKSLNIAHQLIEANVKEGKLKGQIEYLNKENVLLDEKLSVLEEKCNSLHATYDSICLEEEKLKKKQEAVVSLSSSFKKEIATFDTNRQEVKEIVVKSFERSKLDEICNQLELLRNSSVIDVESLLTLPLHEMFEATSVDVDIRRKCVTSLSEIVKLKESVRHKQQLVDSQTYMMDSIASGELGFDSDCIMALSDSVSKLKVEKMELLLSTVQEFLQTTNERVLDTQKIRDAVNNWWEQPSQNIDLGLTVDNKSIKEWIS